MTTKRVYRDQETAVVAGVLSGLAQYFKQDPVVFRLVAIILLILTGVFPGVLFYIVAWLIVPRKPKMEADYTIVE
ncbi:PspC domain-containing protein [Patescibacteria group bacterium]|nr:PspC domain-containing protein [Patescibacteria group bacterium]